MATIVGTAMLSFAGSSTATVVITGQAAITPNCYVEAWLVPQSTADANAGIAVSAGVIVAGSGFTIFGTAKAPLSGAYTVNWTWSDGKSPPLGTSAVLDVGTDSGDVSTTDFALAMAIALGG